MKIKIYLRKILKKKNLRKLLDALENWYEVSRGMKPSRGRSAFVY
jgi:hypothetical protein